MLRALARWPGRRLILLWATVLTLAFGLWIAGAHRRRLDAAIDHRTATWLGAGATANAPPLSAARRDSLAALLFASLRAIAHDSTGADSQAAWLARHPSPLSEPARDSLWRALDVPARLSPVQRDSLRHLAESTAAAVVGPVLQGVMRTLQEGWWVLAIAVAVIYGIPLALVAVTVAWFIARRRYGQSAPSAAA